MVFILTIKPTPKRAGLSKVKVRDQSHSTTRDILVHDFLSQKEAFLH